MTACRFSRRPTPAPFALRRSPRRPGSTARSGPSPDLLLSLALCAVILAGCAGVDPFGPQPLAGAAQSAVQGRGSVMVQLAPDGIATVSGWVEERISAQAVLREVASRPEVVAVVDRIRIKDDYR